MTNFERSPSKGARPRKSARSTERESAETRLSPVVGPEFAAELDRTLAGFATLEDRLEAVSRAIEGRIAFSTSLGLEDQAVLHAIAATGARFDVFTLDTGRHFPETLETLEATELHYGLKIRVQFPDATEVEALVGRDGIMGFRQSVEARKACCEVRKVGPLNRALAGAAGWLTGMRREQSAERSSVPFAQWDAGHGLVKVNPIADWTLADVEGYIARHDIPVNPLHARGFPSIGCQPCTRAILPGEDIRAGRWWWETLDGKECGLHNRPKSKVSA
jgi:phosphoadenosine phosphosulfate reductase